MGSPEQREDEQRTRATLVSYEAAKKAIDEFKQIREVANLGLEGTLFVISNAYFPGHPFYLWPTFPEDSKEDVQKKEAMRPKIEAWDKGLFVYEWAVDIAEEASGVQVPPLSGTVFDIWEQSLIHPSRFQDGRERDELFKQSMKVELEHTETPYAAVTSETRVHHASYRLALVKKIIQQCRRANSLVPEYARAIRENPPFDDPLELVYFLAAGVVLNELYKIADEVEKVKTITGLS